MARDQLRPKEKKNNPGGGGDTGNDQLYELPDKAKDGDIMATLNKAVSKAKRIALKDRCQAC